MRGINDIDYVLNKDVLELGDMFDAVHRADSDILISPAKKGVKLEMLSACAS